MFDLGYSGYEWVENYHNPTLVLKVANFQGTAAIFCFLLSIQCHSFDISTLLNFNKHTGANSSLNELQNPFFKRSE